MLMFMLIVNILSVLVKNVTSVVSESGSELTFWDCMTKTNWLSFFKKGRNAAVGPIGS